MNNVYTRLLMYPITFILGLIPVGFAGYITISSVNYMMIDLNGLAMALLFALFANFAIFAKYGIKDTVFGDQLNLTGSYMRLVGYGLSFLIGLLPAGVVATVNLDLVNYTLGVDLPAFAAAVATSMGLNVGIFQMFGIKRR